VRFPILDWSVVESGCHLADWAAGPRCRGIGSFSSIYQLLCLVVVAFGQDFGGPRWSIEPVDSGSRIPSRCVSRRVREADASLSAVASRRRATDDRCWRARCRDRERNPVDDLFFDYVNRIVQAEPWLTTKMAW